MKTLFIVLLGLGVGGFILGPAILWHVSGGEKPLKDETPKEVQLFNGYMACAYYKEQMQCYPAIMLVPQEQRKQRGMHSHEGNLAYNSEGK